MALPAVTGAILGAKAEPSPGVQNLAPSAEVRFNVTDVLPPSPLYLTANDQIQVTLFDMVGGGLVYIDYQYLLPNGELHAGQENFNSLNLTTNGATGKNFRLPECFLLKVGLLYTGHTAYRGQVYCKVLIARPGSNPIILVAGYLSTSVQLAWPYSVSEPMVNGQGFNVTQAVSNPAVGAEVSFTLPNPYVRGRLTSIVATLTTSAAGPPRLVSLVLNDGIRNFGYCLASTSQPVSVGVNYTFIPAGSSFSPTTGVQQVAMPTLYIIMPGFTVKTNTNFLDAGDQWSNIVASYEMWFDY